MNGREADSWKEVVEKLNQENTELKTAIEDLERRNRELIEKMNMIIVSRATEYKEKALQALARNDSPSKARRSGGISDVRLSQIMEEERRQ